MVQQDHPDRDADCRAQYQWPDIFPVQCLAQFQDAVTLREQTVAGDQCRGLYRCNDVQPYTRYDETHCEPGKAADETASKGRKGKKSENPSIHKSLPQSEVTSTWMDIHLVGRLWIPAVFKQVA